jgi:hypothetical protein
MRASPSVFCDLRHSGRSLAPVYSRMKRADFPLAANKGNDSWLLS